MTPALSGQIIRAWREGRGLTREAASELLNVSPSAVRDAEHGRSYPSFRFLARLSKVAPDVFEAVFFD